MESTPPLKEAPRYLNIFAKLTILFGGGQVQGSLILFILTSLLVPLVLHLLDITHLFIPGDWIKEDAVVSYVRSREKPGFRYYSTSYSYVVNGKTYRQGLQNEKYLNKDGTITILYLSRRPEISRIRNMELDAKVLSERRYNLSMFYLILIFPLVGILALVYELINNIKKIRLLRFGQLIETTCIKKEREVEGNFSFYRYSFEFSVEGQKYVFPKIMVDDFAVEEPVNHWMLFFIKKPKGAKFLDKIPGPKPNAYGDFEATPLKKLVFFILPAIAIGVIYFIISIFI